VVAQSLAFAALVCMAPEKGIEPYRIGMERDGKNVSARIEYALVAVAMMQLHVEDGDAIGLSPQRLCRYGRIVDEAETAGDVGKGMMAGRAAKRIGGWHPGHHRFRGFDCAPGAPQGAFPRFGGDRAGGIGHVIAGLADCGSRVGTIACDRVNVRDDFLGSSLNALPAREDVLEKI